MFVSVCGMFSRHARHAHPRANDFFNSRQQLHDVLMQLAQECKLMGVGIVWIIQGEETGSTCTMQVIANIASRFEDPWKMPRSAVTTCCPGTEGIDREDDPILGPDDK